MATVGTQVSNLSSLVLMAFVPVVTYLCVSVCLLHATLARLATAVVFFRRFVPNETRAWHYISNSTFWLYLANLLLLLLVQNSMKTWLLPADVKYVLQMFTVGGILLLLYEFLVRRTPLDRLLGNQHRACSTAISNEADNQDDGQQTV